MAIWAKKLAHIFKASQDSTTIRVGHGLLGRVLALNKRVHIGRRLRNGAANHVAAWLLVDCIEPALSTELARDGAACVRHLTLSKGDPTEALMSHDAAVDSAHLFNTVIPNEGSPVTNQKASGRCWLFAATNVLPVPIMNHFNIESFELSQKYLYYFDKLEAANYILEQIIDTSDRDVDDRLVQRLLLNPAEDGGQWDMFYNLVDKYGVVPQSLYPDTWSAQNARLLRTILSTKIREFALVLRELARKADADAADAEFAWRFTDKDKKFREHRSTPLAFAKQFTGEDSACDVQNLTSIVHDPRNEPNTRLTIDRLGNVVGGRSASYINVDMDTLKTACVDMIKAGKPIFFGCDFGKFRHRNSGIMDLAIFDYEAGFGTTLLEQNKADRLRSGESLMTHAMILTGVHLDEQTGKPVRRKVQNSHGTETGDKGYLVMTDAWADEFMYQAVVDAKFLADHVKAALKTEPIVLPLWDPLGSLA
ncbi:hypothetical protein NLG97_g3568 [Lecanicillium saksenae]|uniref:Uncharacterized protein n=1 Tax=Lecanicillium saksenae TaxID=468837 RepID=A0ACC1QZL8_9HYPO|nr:hypothetical protein NLG97_g3568 [Lecanicillium saksenae]